VMLARPKHDQEPAPISHWIAFCTSGLSKAALRSLAPLHLPTALAMLAVPAGRICALAERTRKENYYSRLKYSSAEKTGTPKCVHRSYTVLKIGERWSEITP
jgi:hypothetical protein